MNKDTQEDAPIYLIEWVDATGGTGWRDVQGCMTDELAQVFTVGLVVLETDEHICVAQNFSADENAALVDNTTLIPRVNVVRVQQLVEKKGGAKKCQCKKTKPRKPPSKKKKKAGQRKT